MNRTTSTIKKYHTLKNTLHYQPVLAMDLVSLKMHAQVLLLTDELTYCSMGDEDKGKRQSSP